ncbi:DUF4158 domain-containing protein [Edaphobacter aggregans]|uniref:DUF4158 domain-containing protein n=1 Tax=Edaphobacter aggregans TaxID=570835 RepID=UPI000A057367
MFPRSTDWRAPPVISWRFFAKARDWTQDELIEHWTLAPSELVLLMNKSGPGRVGFALLLKFFQANGRFPSNRGRPLYCPFRAGTALTSFSCCHPIPLMRQILAVDVFRFSMPHVSGARRGTLQIPRFSEFRSPGRC